MENVKQPNVTLEDERWMHLALQQAREATTKNEVPVGAVVVYKNQVIGRGYNQREHDFHISHHAEIVALEQASQYLKSWRLKGCTLYVTLEPCLMCTGAIVQSRIDRVVFATRDEKSGAMRSVLILEKIPHLQHHPNVKEGVCADESQQLLSVYFKQKRHEK